MSSFTVSTGDCSHPVVVGELAAAAGLIQELCGDRQVPVVSDARVLELHAEKLQPLAKFVPIELPEGEAAKSWETLRFLTSRFFEIGVSRQTPVVAFGGGSIGDIAGLAAALFKRGCPVVHIPTTLLAQVDSALGGKTGIDSDGQKNLVGTFHPPSLIVCDPVFLETLDERQLRAGFAEVVKYGLIDDPGFFVWCEENGDALLGGNRQARLHAIDNCLRAKARLIGSDLRDLEGRRALLNLGHSFAHAIEALTGFGRVLHGEAVAAGLMLAFRFSSRIDLCPAEDVERLGSYLEQVQLPVRLADVGLANRGPDLLPLLKADKKSDFGEITLILARGIGRAFVARGVSQQKLRDFLGDAP